MRQGKVTGMGKSGFTIVELLTVMAVIAILIGLLAPALGLVHDYAKEVQQKAQFHSIGTGLEMFQSETGAYPPSADNQDDYLAIDSPSGNAYGGAQKLAEAMVGWDLLGFHPASGWRADGANDIDTDGDGTLEEDVLVYDPDAGILGREADGEENINNRKPLFIELENANAYEMQDIYHTDTGDFRADNFVLCDVFSKNRLSGKKTGMPILYYRAKTMFTEQDFTDTSGGAGLDLILNDIYYYVDNYNLLELGVPGEDTYHPLADGQLGAGGTSPAVDSQEDWEDFENMILNEQVTAINKPYRAGSYILISAGKDGLYGTSDDIFNFEKEQ